MLKDIGKNRKEKDTTGILLVKAAEENSNLLTPMAVSSANISAIGAKSDEEFIARRANYLVKLLPDSMNFLAAINRFPQNWLRSTFLVSFIIGVFSNYLGPSQLIHVIYNPLTILLVWNLLVYLFLALKGVLSLRIPESYGRKEIQNNQEGDPASQEKETQTTGSRITDWLISTLVRWSIQLRSRFVDSKTKVVVFKKVLPAFWKSYKKVAGRSLVMRFKSLTNISAVGLLLGALVGVYFRGLFFNYNIIWQSTFVTEPTTITTILNAFFGLASLLLDGSLFTYEVVDELLQPGGTAAGPWIHKMAVTVMLFIFIPRLALALFYSRKAKRSLQPIDFQESYYQQEVLKNRESIMDVIREGIRDIISKKIGKIGQTISAFVMEDYYEKIIVPILVSFREKGGRIRDLEKRLFASQSEFEPILLRYLENVQEDFREGVLTELNLFLGRQLDIDINTISTYQPRSGDADRQLSDRIASDIGDTIGGTIVTTVALAAGSVSGGIGKSLGIAIISGLLGVSGPVGLLIGGLITAATLGGVYKLKRDQISGMVKDVPLPAFIAAVTLSDAKIEKARKETYTHTESEIKKMLEPKIDEVTERIVRDLMY